MSAVFDQGCSATNRQAYWRALSFEEAEARLEMDNSYSRIHTMMEVRGKMTNTDWFRLLGQEWSGCDNISDYRQELAKDLRRASRDHLDLMMDANERRAFAALPEMLTVYRGCYANNRNGLSWTLDRSIAARFPSMMRYWQRGMPLLLTGRVRKATCVLKNDREEREIISPAVRRIDMEGIDMEVTT